ncbi:MAG: aminotransferase class I/II-fold pyridoxal phosphate-dependent enzyme [Firmicutes bacterium]|nr:aminotransferase class I/II-fold pyridoxal phosphate-dependent enzyme [Candidatus Colivicinus equi]
MKFIKKNHDNTKYIDGVFAVSNAVKADNSPDKINASAGCLLDDNGAIITYKTVYESEAKIENNKRASYCEGPQGNKLYNEAIEKFVLEGKVKGKAIATFGGTGAISLAMNMCLQEGDTVMYPETSWVNYSLMAKELNLNSVTYDIYDIDGLLSKFEEQERIFVIINSPCENPTGHSYSYYDWQRIIDKLNSLNKETIILNDIAYIDYAYDEDKKKYFELFNNINENILVLMAYSCSKTFSYYGQRLGALLCINNDEEFVETFMNQCAKHCRCIWSNVNNSAMINIADVINNHLDEFNAELKKNIELVKERADVFIKECSECYLHIYPYREGFFITIKIDDNDYRDKVHKRLLENHIYCVKVNKGIRVGICAASKQALSGLARRMKECK